MLIPAIFVLTLLGFELPLVEETVWFTAEDGKSGHLVSKVNMTDSAVCVYYESDRTIEALLDKKNYQTIWVRKIIKGIKAFEFNRSGDTIRIYDRGKNRTYIIDEKVYDRHALDYVLRTFQYHSDFKKSICVHLPELGIKRTLVKVVGEDNVATALGDIPAWQIELSAGILFLRWRFYFLIEKDYPHRFLKYRDGHHIMEIIKYQCKSD